MHLHRFTPTLLAAVILTTGFSRAGVTFGPPNVESGESVRLVVRSEVPKGSVETSSPSGSSGGSIKILRERDIYFTPQNPAGDGSARVMMRIPKFESTTTINLGGAPDITTERSPLVGMQVAALRGADGDWSFTGDGNPITNQAKAELEEIKAYQTRNWFPERDLNIGDSWEFDPAWLRLVIQRDLKDAQMLGTMKLRQVRRTRLMQFALVDIDIRSSGASLDSDGRGTGATVALTGEARINLNNMLDEKVDLSGTIEMRSHDSGKRTTFHLPIRLSATKTIERPGARPLPTGPPPNSQPEPNSLPGPNSRSGPNSLPPLPPIVPDKGPAIPRPPRNSFE